MKYDAMIIIDMQTGLIEDNPYQKDIIINNIKILIDKCRFSDIPVIHIRHDGGKGDELEKDTLGWQIYQDFMPYDNEKIIDKKFNSAFLHTDLNLHLQSLDIKNVLMCGMQTEYCFDVTCKVAYELGYHVIIAKETTTTFDNEFFSAKDLCLYYENKIWNNRYADVLDMNTILENICG